MYVHVKVKYAVLVCARLYAPHMKNMCIAQYIGKVLVEERIPRSNKHHPSNTK